MQKAFDILENKPTMKSTLGRSSHPKAVQLLHRTAYCALIKHQQWLNLVLSVKERKDGASTAAKGRYSSTGAAAAGKGEMGNALACSSASSMTDTFCYNSVLWLRVRTERGQKVLLREVEGLLKEALAMRPSATMLSYIMCQVYLVSGRFNLALMAAEAACKAAPNDPDALALEIMIQQVCAPLVKDAMYEEGASADAKRESRVKKTKATSEAPTGTALTITQSRMYRLSAAVLDSADAESVTTHHVGELQLRALHWDPYCGAALQGKVALAPA
eukprot:gene20200-26945_t